MNWPTVKLLYSYLLFISMKNYWTYEGLLFWTHSLESCSPSHCLIKCLVTLREYWHLQWQHFQCKWRPLLGERTSLCSTSLVLHSLSNLILARFSYCGKWLTSPKDFTVCSISVAKLFALVSLCKKKCFFPPGIRTSEATLGTA